jgi:hypothetical protein
MKQLFIYTANIKIHQNASSTFGDETWRTSAFCVHSVCHNVFEERTIICYREHRYLKKSGQSRMGARVMSVRSSSL